MAEEHALPSKRPAQIIQELEHRIHTLEAEIDQLHIRSDSFTLKTLGDQKDYKDKLLNAAAQLEDAATDMGEHVWISTGAFHAALDTLRNDDSEFDYN